MINYEKQYKDLHGAEVETIMYIADALEIDFMELLK